MWYICSGVPFDSLWNKHTLSDPVISGFWHHVNSMWPPQDKLHICVFKILLHQLKIQLTESQVCLIHRYNIKDQPCVSNSANYYQCAVILVLVSENTATGTFLKSYIACELPILFHGLAPETVLVKTNAVKM